VERRERPWHGRSAKGRPKVGQPGGKAARATTGAFRTTNQGASSLESGIKPAVAQLDNRLRHFALRLASLPRGDRARELVGAVGSALGQRLQSALGCWNGREETGLLEVAPSGRDYHDRRRGRSCAGGEPARPARPDHFHGRISPGEWSDWLRSHMEKWYVLERTQNPYGLGTRSLRRRMRRPCKGPTGGGHQKPHNRIGHHLHGRARGHLENDCQNNRE